MGVAPEGAGGAGADTLAAGAGGTKLRRGAAGGGGLGVGASVSETARSRMAGADSVAPSPLTGGLRPGRGGITRAGEEGSELLGSAELGRRGGGGGGAPLFRAPGTIGFRAGGGGAG